MASYFLVPEAWRAEAGGDVGRGRVGSIGPQTGGCAAHSLPPGKGQRQVFPRRRGAVGEVVADAHAAAGASGTSREDNPTRSRRDADTLSIFSLDQGPKWREADDNTNG